MRSIIIAIFVGHIALACSSRTEGTEVNDCTDRADNDGDGRFDCDDEGCAAGPDCQEVRRQEYIRSCNGGEAEACKKLGFMYSRGAEATKDELLAGQYYQQACSLKDVTGCKKGCELFIFMTQPVLSIS